MNATEIDTDFLEDLFADEIKCESRTHDYGHVQCSGDVSYLLSPSCLPPTKICSAMGLRAKWRISGKENVCGNCKEHCSECWTIRPI